MYLTGGQEGGGLKIMNKFDKNIKLKDVLQIPHITQTSVYDAVTFNRINQWIFDIKFIKQLIEVDKTRGILKTTNEELSPSTYRSASTKLRNLGHIKRPEALSAYANEIEQREKEANMTEQELEELKKKKQEKKLNKIEESDDDYNSET